MRTPWLALGLLAGCTEEKFYSSGLATPIAVGATASGAIYSETCTKIDKHVDCEMPSVTSSYDLTGPPSRAAAASRSRCSAVDQR